MMVVTRVPVVNHSSRGSEGAVLLYLVKYRTSECSMPAILSSVDIAARSATVGFAPFMLSEGTGRCGRVKVVIEGGTMGKSQKKTSSAGPKMIL